jgi:hypothetical protein
MTDWIEKGYEAGQKRKAQVSILLGDPSAYEASDTHSGLHAMDTHAEGNALNRPRISLITGSPFTSHCILGRVGAWFALEQTGPRYLIPSSATPKDPCALAGFEIETVACHCYRLRDKIGK